MIRTIVNTHCILGTALILVSCGCCLPGLHCSHSAPAGEVITTDCAVCGGGHAGPFTSDFISSDGLSVLASEPTAASTPTPPAAGSGSRSSDFVGSLQTDAENASPLPLENEARSAARNVIDALATPEGLATPNEQSLPANLLP